METSTKFFNNLIKKEMKMYDVDRYITPESGEISFICNWTEESNKQRKKIW